MLRGQDKEGVLLDLPFCMGLRAGIVVGSPVVVNKLK
jgi:hypothetical protein